MSTVYIPETRADIDRVLKRHAALGFPGAITMFDGTKWEWGACPHAWQAAHTGKEGYPTKTFMVAGDMNSMIHHISGSEIGARNDMTCSLFDDYIQSMKSGDRFANEVFYLYKGDGSGEMSGLSLALLSQIGIGFASSICEAAAAAGGRRRRIAIEIVVAAQTFQFSMHLPEKICLPSSARRLAVTVVQLQVDRLDDVDAELACPQKDVAEVLIDATLLRLLDGEDIVAMVLPFVA